MSEPIVMHCSTVGCDYHFQQTSTAGAAFLCPRCGGSNFHCDIVVTNKEPERMVPESEVLELKKHIGHLIHKLHDFCPDKCSACAAAQEAAK